MSLLIKNGEIITADSRYTADILCVGETITRIDRDIAAPPGADTVADAGLMESANVSPLVAEETDMRFDSEVA